MDISEKQAKWRQERPLFEAELIHSHLLPFFNFNENTGDYEIKVESVANTDDEDRKVAYETLNTGWVMWLRAKRNATSSAVSNVVSDIQSWIAVKSFSALDVVHENTPIIDANELAKYIDSLNLNVSVPEGFVLVNAESLALHAKSIRMFNNSEEEEDYYEIENHVCAIEAMIEAQEPAPLKLGDLVKPIDHRYTLASGCERYPYAYVVNTNPFQLMSEEGDMYWCCTVEAGGYKLIKSNDQLPEAVSLRMIREGLLSPVEAQEPAND